MGERVVHGLAGEGFSPEVMGVRGLFPSAEFVADLATWMELFWRVRELRWQFDVTYQDGNNMSGSQILTHSVPLADELHHVSSSVGFTGGAMESGSVNAGASSTITPVADAKGAGADDYYIQIIATGTHTSASSRTVQVGTTRPDVPAADKMVIQISFMGITLDAVAVATEFGNQDTILSFTASLEPIEWWEYAQRDGLPVYDTSTGNVLPGRDPFA